jgi:hypothetical protein
MGIEASKSWKYCIAACARWETPHINEWLAYHRSIGFSHVVLYCNDDDPAELFEMVLPFTQGDHPFVTFVHYPYVGVQKQMYRHFLREFSRYTDWFIFLDIDEFLVLRRDGVVSRFLDNYAEQYSVIYINWLFFGHSGFKVRPPGSVLLNYSLRAEQVNAYTKVFVKYEQSEAERLGQEGDTGFWHKWGAETGKDNNYVNVLQENMTGYYDDFPVKADYYLSKDDRSAAIIDIAVVYHYAFRSEEDIERRLSRGVSGDFAGQVGFRKVLEGGYQDEFLRQFAQREDTTLQKYWQYVIDGGARSGIAQRPKGINIAAHKPAEQSSISSWSRGQTTAEDASSVVAGNFSGDYNCHTDSEDSPWWSVDLLGLYDLRQIIIYNRIDKGFFRNYTLHFSLTASEDGASWVVLRDGAEACSFGGTDGHPYVWRSEIPVRARFVRIQLPGNAILHLDSVEVYDTLDEEPASILERYGPLAARIDALTKIRAPDVPRESSPVSAPDTHDSSNSEIHEGGTSEIREDSNSEIHKGATSEIHESSTFEMHGSEERFRSGSGRELTVLPEHAPEHAPSPPKHAPSAIDFLIANPATIPPAPSANIIVPGPPPRPWLQKVFRRQ